MQEVHERTDGLLAALLPEVERRFHGKHARILLVSHAATIIALARTLLGDRERPLRVGCCSLSEFDRQDGRWEARRLADGAHLADGASREWGLEDIEIAAGKVGLSPLWTLSEHWLILFYHDRLLRTRACLALSPWKRGLLGPKSRS